MLKKEIELWKIGFNRYSYRLIIIVFITFLLAVGGIRLLLVTPGSFANKLSYLGFLSILTSAFLIHLVRKSIKNIDKKIEIKLSGQEIAKNQKAGFFEVVFIPLLLIVGGIRMLFTHELFYRGVIAIVISIYLFYSNRKSIKEIANSLNFRKK